MHTYMCLFASYDIPELIQRCAIILSNSITMINVLQRYHLSQKYDLCLLKVN